MRRKESPSSVVPAELDAGNLSVAVVVARFNEDVTDELLAGARACLRDHGVSSESVDVFRVPGAWELPQAAARVVEAGRHDAVVALGCVIRGETPHFDFISAEAARGLGAVARGAPVPVTFGVLTTDTLEQALERAARDRQDKGREAATAALEMIGVFRRIGDPGTDGERPPEGGR